MYTCTHCHNDKSFVSTFELKWTPNPLHKGIDFTAEQNFLTKFPCFQLNFMCCLNRKISLIASKYFFELLFVYDIILK